MLHGFTEAARKWAQEPGGEYCMYLVKAGVRTEITSNDQVFQLEEDSLLEMENIN